VTTGPDQEFTTVLIESESAKNLGGEGATLEAQINPLGKATTYHFEYGESSAYTTSVPAPDAAVGSGEVDQTVEQSISGLHPETTYHYRVVATVSELGTGYGPDRTFTTHTGGGVAKLLDGRAYEMVSPPDKHGGFIEGISVGGGSVQAAENGSGMAYVVQGTIREDAEGNRSPEAQQVLSTRGAERWSSQEIVAPPERAFGLHGNAQQEYMAFSPNLALSLLQPAPFGQTPLAEPPLSPPQSEAERGHQEKTIYIRQDAPILPEATEKAIWEQARHNGEVLAEEHHEASAKPGYEPLVTAANVKLGVPFGGEQIPGFREVVPSLGFLNATPDLTHVILTSNKALAPTPPSAPGLYEWSRNELPTKELQLVSILPNGQPYEAGEAQLGLGVAELKRNGGINLRHAISNDGSRVFWTTPEGVVASIKEVGHLYLRDTVKKQTIQLDLPETGSFAEAGKAAFQIASSDGSKVFFTDTQRLTANSTAAPEEGPGTARPDLYECEIVEVSGKLTCKLRDLTANTSAGESGAVQGLVLGASEDGRYVYAVADGVLGSGVSEGAVPGNCRSFTTLSPPKAPVTCNLYVLHDENGEGKWATRFIARLSSEDAPDWFNPNENTQLLVDQPTRSSPNGRFLAFMSNRRLTGYDNTDVNEKGGRHADEEVFLYDAEKATLTCASCNPSGARPRGVFDAQLAGEGKGLAVDRPEVWAAKPTKEGENNPGIDHWLAGNVPGWTTLSIADSIYQSRYLSDSGRLFFNSADALLPEAAGHTRLEKVVSEEAKAESSVGVENVYEYEPEGVGSCGSAGGCRALISSGTANSESAFLDASASGSDVFFLTAAPLLPQDRDQELDVYDARVCTPESPCQTPSEPPPPPCHEVSTCRGGTFPTPGFQPPPSTSLSGSGNIVPGPPKSGTAPVKVSKRPTRAQKLAAALRACRKLPNKTGAQKHRRGKCEAQARKKYGAKKAGKRRKK
jgi:hypothetical protein